MRFLYLKSTYPQRKEVLFAVRTGYCHPVLFQNISQLIHFVYIEQRRVAGCVLPGNHTTTTQIKKDTFAAKGVLLDLHYYPPRLARQSRFSLEKGSGPLRSVRKNTLLLLIRTLLMTIFKML